MNKVKRENIENFSKIFVMLTVMWTGFFFGYACLWFWLNLPAERWSVALLSALAALTDFGYFKWLMR